MSPKSLFIIILRIVGLFLFVDILRVVPQLFSTFNVLLHAGEIQIVITGIIASLLLILVYFYVVKYVLFNSDKIVDKLSLDKNFSEEKFELNIHRSTVIKIAIIIIGGMTIVEYFVPLILDLFSFIQSRNNMDNENSISKMTLVRELLMVLIGYFLISNSRTITNWVDKRRKN
jgi:hypothetical protein